MAKTTENLSILTIHKLSQEQYDRELFAGRLDETALYLTPEEDIDLSMYATVEQLNEKADNEHTHTADEVGALPNTTVIPTVPTNVSAFINDAGYLTEHQNLDAYAKVSDLGALATKDSLTASDVGALPDTTEIPSIEGLASESYVIEQIENIPIDDIISDVEDSISDALTEAKAYSDKKGGYTEPETKIVWDGDTTGLFAIPYEGVIGYKVSDNVIDLSKVTRLVDNEGQEIDLENYRVLTEGIVQALAAPELYVAVIPEDTEIQGFPVPKGTYFVESIRSIEAGEIIHPIKPKFLPEGGFGYTEDKLVVVGRHTCYLVEEVERYEPVPYILYYTPSYKYNFTVDRSLLINGKEVNVIWDGSLFTCKIHILDDGDEMVIGNGSLDGSGHDTGEPFSISIFPAHGSISVCSKDRGGEHTFEIFFGYGAVHKIDPKYLPDGGFGYTESAKIINIFNEQTCTFTDYFSEGYVNYMKFELIDDFSLIRDSDKVDVIWDGEKYSCSFYRGDGGELVGGTAGAMYYGQFSFAISEDYAELWSRTEGEHTFSMSVSLKDEVVHKIDTKYLPEGSVGYTEDAYEIYWNGDTDGKLMYLDMFVQVSEDTVDFSQVEDCLGMTDAGEISILDPNFGSGTLETLNIDEYTNAIMLSGQPAVVTTTKDHYLYLSQINGSIYIKKGTYFAYTNSSSYIYGLKIKEVVHTIDPKYIPENSTDVTLTEAGKAADAKVVGDAVKDLVKAVEQMDEKLGKIDNVVLSVNGITPDENGNVEVISSGSTTSIELDTTLTIEGAAADAKAVGDALARIGIVPGNAVATGETIVLTDATNKNLVDMHILGKSIQNGTPSFDNPAQFENIGTDGSVVTQIGTSESDENMQRLSVSTPNGLLGIPVTYEYYQPDGNYTDENGVKWICDEIDFVRGKYIKRVEKVSLRIADMNNGENYPGWKGITKINKHFAEKNGYFANFCVYACNVARADGGYVSINTLNNNGIVFFPPEKNNNVTQSYLKETYPDLVVDIYFSIEPEEISLSVEELQAFASLHTYSPITYIYADGAYMSVEYSTYAKNSMNNSDDFEHEGLPVLYLNGDTTSMTKDNAVSMDYQYKDRSGTCTVKWQGNSSLAYPKKNYTVKFDEKFEAKEGWGEQKKYCLKANFIDASHARNIVSAVLWSNIVATRDDGIFENAPKYGVIDGFPIILKINDAFAGLYTFNIPKDGWMFGLSDETLTQAIVCAEGDAANKGAAFKEPAKLDETDFSLEYVSDEDNSEWVKTSLNRLINACINSDGTDLDTTIAQYLDWQSAIDFLCYACLIGGYDLMVKNYLLVTLDGTKWYFSAYDLDSTFGLFWKGDSYYNPRTCYPKPDSFAFRHRLMELICTYKKDELKERYDYIRKNVMATWDVHTEFYNFVAQIPSVVLNEDWKKWQTIPNTSGNNLAQITDWYRCRIEVLDDIMENL